MLRDIYSHDSLMTDERQVLIGVFLTAMRLQARRKPASSHIGLVWCQHSFFLFFFARPVVVVDFVCVCVSLRFAVACLIAGWLSQAVYCCVSSLPGSILLSLSR